mmetsp:Transcript_28244/g.79324  ORF Transcript_28244/g.79324 Transcript_28244/m.79324 type:complete len:242 (-) Transcript_28244:66-791(-)
MPSWFDEAAAGSSENKSRPLVILCRPRSSDTMRLRLGSITPENAMFCRSSCTVDGCVDDVLSRVSSLCFSSMSMPIPMPTCGSCSLALAAWKPLSLAGASSSTSAVACASPLAWPKRSSSEEDLGVSGETGVETCSAGQGDPPSATLASSTARKPELTTVVVVVVTVAVDGACWRWRWRLFMLLLMVASRGASTADDTDMSSLEKTRSLAGSSGLFAKQTSGIVGVGVRDDADGDVVVQSF